MVHRRQLASSGSTNRTLFPASKPNRSSASLRIEVRRPHVGLDQPSHFVVIESAQAEHVVLPLLLPDKPPLTAPSAFAAPEPPEGFAP